MTSAAPPRTRDTGTRRWLPVIAVGLLTGVIKAEAVVDPNVLWEIRNGRQILSAGHLPHADQWSWTVPGKSWVPNSWAWDVVLGAADRIGGGAALAILNIAVVLLLVLVMAHSAFTRGARAAAVVAAIAVVGGLVLLTWINDRPQLISYVFVAALVPLVGPALTTSRRRFVILLAGLFLLQVVWVNLHFFAIIGPALVAFAGGGRLAQHVRTRATSPVSLREQAVRVVLGTAIAFAGCCVTPYGAVVAAKTLAVHNDAAGLIVEWRPAGFATFAQFTGVVALVAAVAAAWHAYRNRRWDVVAALVLLALGTAVACRMAPATAVVAIPELASALTGAMARPAPRRLVVGVTALSAVVGLGLAGFGLPDFGRLQPPGLSLLRRLPSDCRLLNDYPLGGSVILFRPDVPVAVDSRTDLYGKARILVNRRLVAGRGHAVRTVTAEAITCVLVPSTSGLVAELRRTAGWHVAGTDSVRTLLLRN